ncbi:MAG: hypothetical protein EBR82_09185 [Caulobacteraceae bacterium]|nr:hypothetical protein [Caulobacteraceae bacterium]
MALDLVVIGRYRVGGSGRRFRLARGARSLTGTLLSRPPVVERAYQIADSGVAASTKILRTALVAEGYGFGEVAAALNGLAIRRSLKARIAMARSARDNSGGAA